MTRREFKSPVHISKPYWDGHSLLLNLMCPTAGMLGNDKVELDIEVDRDAALTLSNPSSLRIHKMDSFQEATWAQRFSVAENAFLEVNPEWLILQGESAFLQRTEIQLAASSELFFAETISPGRIAYGESFQFRRFKNRLALRYDDQLAALEKHCLEPASSNHLPWSESAPFYASLFLVSPKLDEKHPLWTEIYALQNDEISVGSSQLAAGPCWNVKLLAKNPALARKTIEQIRQHFFSAIGRIPHLLRRQ